MIREGVFNANKKRTAQEEVSPSVWERMIDWTKENVEPSLVAAGKSMKGAPERAGGLFKSGISALGGGDFNTGLASLVDFAKSRGMDAYHTAGLATSANLGKPETEVSQTSIGYDPLGAMEKGNLKRLKAQDRDRSEAVREQIFAALANRTGGQEQKNIGAIDKKMKQEEAFSKALDAFVK
jgi:hypothetical protein